MMGTTAIAAGAVALARPKVPASPWIPLQRLEIVTLGERNPRARSSEVWVRHLYLPDGERVSAREFELQGPWKIAQGVPLVHQCERAVLRWQRRLRGDAKLYLISHPWSGIVEITWNGKAQRIDLFSERKTLKIIPLKISGLARHMDTLFRLAVLGSLTIALMTIVFPLSVVLAVRPVVAPGQSRYRWRWLCPIASIAVFVVGMQLAPARGHFCWRKYWRDATQARSTLPSRLASLRVVRAFLREHIPRGSVVLANEQDAQWLVTLHDVRVLAPNIGSIAVHSMPQRREDLADLLRNRTPWTERRRLLQQYGIEWFLSSAARAERLHWLDGHAVEKRRFPVRRAGAWECGKDVLIRIDTPRPAAAPPHPPPRERDVIYLPLLFWLVLLLPGYVAIRLWSPADLESGLLGTIALSYLASFALLSPVAILAYIFRLPLAVLSGSYLGLCAVALILISQRRWWFDLGKLLVGAASFGLLILILDLILGSRVGAHGGGDAILHMARIRFLLENGISNQDPYVEVPAFFVIYHTNLYHALQAACAQLLQTDHFAVWFVSLVWAKLVVAGGCYYLGWCVFGRPWPAWTTALLMVGWLGPRTYLAYPNHLASYWLIPLALGAAVSAWQQPRAWSTPLKLGAAMLVLGQVHGLYAIFVGLVTLPVFSLLFVGRLVGRRPRWHLPALCLVALSAGAPFLLASKLMLPPTTEVRSSLVASPVDENFYRWENGWHMYRPRLFAGRTGYTGMVLAAAGTVLILIGPRRRAGVALAIMTGTAAAILFGPPVCAWFIEQLGAQWRVARLNNVLVVLFAVLVAGAAAHAIELLTGAVNRQTAPNAGERSFQPVVS